MRRSPEWQCESGRTALGSFRPRLRTPASAGHPAQSSTGRDTCDAHPSLLHVVRRRPVADISAGRARKMGCCAAVGHAHQGGAAHRMPRRAHPAAHPTRDRPVGADQAAEAAHLRIRDQHWRASRSPLATTTTARTTCAISAAGTSPSPPSLGFVNTLILQYILGEPEWAGVLGDSDLRGITPLFTSNMSSTPTVDLPSDTPAPKQRLRSDSGCSVRRSSSGQR